MAHVLRFRFFFMYVFWMDLHFLSATLLGQMQNVALNKTTHQVSTDPQYGGVSSRAVDGNTNQQWAGGSCMLSLPEVNPFWQVDLGDVYVVDTVKIYKRLDAGSELASNVETAVSLDGYNFTLACYHEGQIPDIYTCEPGTRVIGRWVKITVLSNTPTLLHICEVEVMSDQTVGRDRFRSRPLIQGTGSVLETKRIVSHVQCLFCCFCNINCVGANVVNLNNNFTTDIVNSPNMECELLGQGGGETVTHDAVLWVLDI